MASSYDSVRANVNESGEDSRVEVNQRALIDKILARYASAGAVYRELIQNSNDAEASEAEIQFTIDGNNIVQQVVYKNNGFPFRTQDWDRLKKIAEGNPDVSKVGAFGVGAYTMFSICEEPLVISGTEALAFIWRGDALWTKTAPNKDGSLNENGKWTSFILPSRDPYPLPNLVEFGEFLCASLTFTKCLKQIKVFVNNTATNVETQRLLIQKTMIQEPTVVQPPKSSSWWKNDGANTASSNGTFYLPNSKQSILETVYDLKVVLDGEMASVKAKYVTVTAKTKISQAMAKRMERVTKKNPPSEVNVQIFINAQEDDGKNTATKSSSKAARIVKSFSPQPGVGRIFIGFRTSQTTGFAAHLAAPFIPTVEREAIDMQDPTLRMYNSELLQFSGIIMRLTLEHSMSLVDVEWQQNQEEREKLEKQLLLEAEKGGKGTATTTSEISNSEQTSTTANSADDDDNSDDETTTNGVGGSIMSFARYMAKGVKKKIVSVVNNVIDDGSALLNPKDPIPLFSEERNAILLMQSFCPRQSTPDANIGAALAQGFSICMPNMAVPVLTRSGVMRGNEARLPNQGIEVFVKNNVVRRVVFENAEEYHTIIARCSKLNLDDLTRSITSEVLQEDKMIFFIKWWTKFCQVYHVNQDRGIFLKENIRYYPGAATKSASTTTTSAANASLSFSDTANNNNEGQPVAYLRDLIFYIDSDSLLSNEESIPLPDSVLPKMLQEQIGIRALNDDAVSQWFSPLPMEIWVEFISHHPCMTTGQPEDEKLRLQVLVVLSKEYSHRQFQERAVFGGFCQSVLSDKRCIPFDSSEPTAYAADLPSNLYLYSAELKAFDGIGSFHKAAHALQTAGVIEEFLLALGVRKSVAVDFLFSNLDTLKWSDDPKPLIEYLRTATLSKSDWDMLKTTQYLPAANDKTRTFAPRELFLPDAELKVFPFVRMLQWPSEEVLSERSPDGAFLLKVGVRHLPSLAALLKHISENVKEDEMRLKCLDYVCKRMGPNGVYQNDYSYLRYNQRKDYRILPCVIRSCLDPTYEKSQLHSPVTCFSDPECGIMGFPIIDPKLGETGKLYGSLFQCKPAPEPNALLQQLVNIVRSAKSWLESRSTEKKKENAEVILKAFSSIFRYLSSRTSEFPSSSLSALKREHFIPCLIDDSNIEWYRPDYVFFKSSDRERDSVTEALFQALVDFSPFLAAVGVREEATAKDLFEMMVASPEDVFRKLGSEQKYRMLLRRIAANPPFSRVTPEIRKSPFLLAYTISQSAANGKNGSNSEEKTNYKLAKAADIYIIDNSFFGRMFSVNRAPHESDLEEFYYLLGSTYISKKVDKRFEVGGAPVVETTLSRALRERLDERGPLLVSPSVTSRPLVSNASDMLDKDKLIIYKAANLLAVYELEKTVRRQKVTCCSRPLNAKKNALYVTQDFDWFDVGYAIGDMILQRCQLEDAFFISSLLEAPLEQLRARGFPVDRILKPEPVVPIPEPKPRPIPAATVASVPAAATPSPATSSTAVPAAAKSVPNNNGGGPVQSAEQSANPTIATIPPKPAPAASSAPSKPTAPAPSPPAAPAPASEKEANSKNATPTAQKNETKQDSQASGSAKPEIDPDHSANEPIQDKEELMRAMKQMFPDADTDFMRKKLGESPTMASVHSLIEEMAAGDYPKKKKKGGITKKLGRAFGFGSGGGSAGHGLEGAMPQIPSQLADAVKPAAAGPSPGTATSPMSQPTSNFQPSKGPATPQEDSQSHENLENMLKNTVTKSAPVNSSGVKSSDTLLTNIPEGLDRGSTCEVVPGHSLKPFAGLRGDGQTHNNIRVFSSRNYPESEAFLQENLSVVELFSLVIARLCTVFELKLDSVAIFHDPSGGTIAFNANRALHFNVRFFYSLHFLSDKFDSPDCYSYWFVTMAHELAHHLASGHNKEHGFYTESYVTMYLPKLVSLLSTL